MSAHPPSRFSVLSANSISSTDSGATSATRFSLPSVSTTPKPAGVRPNIYDRPLNKTRTTEVSASAFAFLFSEVVQYTQKRVSGIADLERRCVGLQPVWANVALTSSFLLFDTRLNTLGYRIGTRVLELMVWRSESASKAPKREIRFLPALMSIHTQVWRAVFGKPADALEKSVENEDECALQTNISMAMEADPQPSDMIIDNDPSITKYISVPRDMSSLSCSSFTAGIVEAVLDGLGFVGTF